MKKDIEIPEVKGVYVAAVREKHAEYQTMDWNAYIINDTDTALEMVLLVTRGYTELDTTSTMRHSIKVLPAKSFAKIEFLQEDVLKLNNEFAVTFFADNKMFERTYVFEQNTIAEKDVKALPVMIQKGILAS
ncbi:hypothetical protein SAMN04487764_0780 [Gillisia sp. Hel1_33_143]|uniref:hypothetical protein n=1 Tax=Gillisia sp. Hel1_33_143 TaxID=1336796 RepID=UPI00087C3FE3|nr:hypothetical protein [Gillisia sp. Hel1_33_143]SDR82659.1 hypothetical protein SAMN04487764_0780 [Gillisia sp. Hel1_33_143]